MDTDDVDLWFCFISPSSGAVDGLRLSVSTFFCRFPQVPSGL